MPQTNRILLFSDRKDVHDASDETILAGALRKEGFKPELCFWRESQEALREPLLGALLLAPQNFESEKSTFKEFLRNLETHTPMIWNPPSLLRWALRENRFESLAKAKIPVLSVHLNQIEKDPSEAASHQDLLAATKDDSRFIRLVTIEGVHSHAYDRLGKDVGAPPRAMEIIHKIESLWEDVPLFATYEFLDMGRSQLVHDIQIINPQMDFFRQPQAAELIAQLISREI